jgi:mannosyltransferase
MNESVSIVRRLWDRPIVPIAIVLIGLFLSLYRIDAQSLWGNEAFSVAASSKSLAEMRDTLIQDFVNPPLHYYLLHVWMRLLGTGSLQARLLSAIFGALAIGVSYLLGKYLFDRKTALLAAAVLAVSQIRIQYSQEVRSYELLLLLTVCAAYLLVRALYERSVLLWWAFVLATAAMLYTHYFSVFAAGVMYLYAFLYRRKYDLPLSRLISGAVVVAALLAPWLVSGVVEVALNSPKTLPAKQASWFSVHWWTVGTTVNRLNNGYYFELEWGSKWWNYLAGTLLLCFPAALALKPLLNRSPVEKIEASERERLLFLAALFVFPLCCLLALGALKVQYHPRYVLHIVVPYYLLVARGLVSLGSPALRRGLITLLLLYSLGSLHALYFTSYKEDYRGALGEVARGYREGDCALFLPKGIPLQWSIYYGDPSRLRIVTMGPALRDQASCKRLWAVSYCRADGTCDSAHRELQSLQPQYAPLELKRFFWVEVQLYRLNSSAAPAP